MLWGVLTCKHAVGRTCAAGVEGVGMHVKEERQK